MKKILLAALAASAALALAGCGSANDASKDAMADNVEVPADSAMAGTPMPADDASASADQSPADTTSDAQSAAAQAQAMVASDAVEGAIGDAEKKMQ